MSAVSSLASSVVSSAAASATPSGASCATADFTQVRLTFPCKLLSILIFTSSLHKTWLAPSAAQPRTSPATHPPSLKTAANPHPSNPSMATAATTACPSSNLFPTCRAVSWRTVSLPEPSFAIATTRPQQRVHLPEELARLEAVQVEAAVGLVALAQVEAQVLPLVLLCHR